MLRGINKQVVVVRDTGNDMFEQVIFILKPGGRRGDDGNMALEAKRIVAECIKRYCPGSPRRARRKTNARLLLTALAMAASAGLTLLVLLIAGVL